jgi:hypothetical protein
MRRPYEIMKMRKKLSNRRLFVEIEKRLERAPHNCNHNQRMPLGTSSMEVGVCALNQPVDEGRIFICNDGVVAKGCSAYSAKCKNANDVAQAVLKENPSKSERDKLYPEVSALKWVLAEKLHDIEQNPPNIIVRVLLWLIRIQESFLESLWQPRQKD